MSITHNQFKNIETRVFSPEIYDLNKEQLLGLKKELNQTYNDAKQNNQILERWNIVDAKLSQLIKDISTNALKQSNNWRIMFVGTFLASVLAVAGYVVYDFYIKPNLEPSTHTKKTTSTK